MSVASDHSIADLESSIGRRMYALVEQLYPICRSITGAGVRETLAELAKLVPLDVHEVPSGTQVFDWVVPKEWNIREAYLRGPDGRTIVDFADHNLHVMSYSTPVRATLSLAEIRPHLFSMPEQPDLIPYRTSYYREDWGFCLPHRVLAALPEGEYEVVIDSTLAPGSLSYGELFIPGESDREILIFSHLCHPSLCNDNLSGLAVTAYLAAAVGREKRKYGYRFVWAPGTIGSICWLSLNERNVDRIAHGLVLALVGDRGPLTYKKSRRETTQIDLAAMHVLQRYSGSRVIPFSPYGYDERQFCSPGFDLSVGRLTRTPNGEYPEYHSSADDLSFVTPESLADSYRAAREILDVLDGDGVFLNQLPKCEPQLGKRGLYRLTGGKRLPEREWAILWVLNQSDGEHSLLDIATRSGLPFATIRSAADELLAAGLLSA